MLCELETRIICKHCGQVYPDKLHPPMPCPNRNVAQLCVHLEDERLNADQVPIKVKCGCTQEDQERMHTVWNCAVHKRCLPSLQLTDEMLEKWNERDDSKVFHLCGHYCQDFKLPTKEN